MHNFHPTILREYDIRGIVGETLSTDDARAVGRCFGTVIKRSAREGSEPNKIPRVCVGYDGRVSSPDMEKALVEGLTAAGVNVERVGRGPTPMLYFATIE